MIFVGARYALPVRHRLTIGHELLEAEPPDDCATEVVCKESHFLVVASSSLPPDGDLYAVRWPCKGRFASRIDIRLTDCDVVIASNLIVNILVRPCQSRSAHAGWGIKTENRVGWYFMRHRNHVTVNAGIGMADEMHCMDSVWVASMFA